MMRPVTRGHLAALVIVIVLALVPAAAALAGQPFYVDLLARIMIFGIAALSLDLILGFGGLVSFGHASYLAIGAYAVAILGFHEVTSGWLHMAAAIGACALVALAVGAVSLRTTGIHFIMITLAFGQLVYLLGTSIDLYGGEDGMNIASHSSLAGLDLEDPDVLYYVILFWLFLFLVLSERLVHSRFGMVLRGSRSNDRRMLAIGIPTYRYRLAAYVISACMCGTAGFLLANQNLFVSPALAHWSRSGEIMVMVILGGMGSLYGAVAGAAVFLLLESGLSRITDHWQLLLGPILVLIILFARRGLWGLLAAPARWRR
jgi:branched-chain amino acid transport system permease protein